MVNRRELAICRRRGHSGSISEGWKQCQWCRMWLREVRKIEEREDEPPESELDIRVLSQRRLDQVTGEMDQTKSALDRLRRGDSPAPKKPRGKK